MSVFAVGERSKSKIILKVHVLVTRSGKDYMHVGANSNNTPIGTGVVESVR